MPLPFPATNNRLPAGSSTVLCSAETKVTARTIMQRFDERLRRDYPQLTPQEQRVADFIFDHYDDLIGYNSAELARLERRFQPRSAACSNGWATPTTAPCGMSCAPCAKVACR